MRSSARRVALVALAAAAAGGALGLGMRGCSERPLPANWNPGKGVGFVGLGGERLTLLDRDADGRVDCLIAGRLGVLGSPSFAASNGAGCGWMGIRSRSLPDELRSDLSEVLALKTRMGIGAGVPLDRDGDGSVDCVVSVFYQDTALARRAGVPCGEKQINPPRPVDWDDAQRIASLEKRLGEWLAAPSR